MSQPRGRKFFVCIEERELRPLFDQVLSGLECPIEEFESFEALATAFSGDDQAVGWVLLYPREGAPAALEQLGARVPLIFVGRAEDFERVSGLELNLEAFVEVPFSPHLLQNCLEESLGPRGLGQQRRSVRIASSIDAEMSWAGQVEKGRVKNFSTTGVFYAKPEGDLPQIGDELELKIFALPDESKGPVEARARVQWTDGSTFHDSRGFGVEFIQFHQGSRLRWLKFTARYKRSTSKYQRS